MLHTQAGRAHEFIEVLLDHEGDKARRARAVVREARRASWSYFRRMGDALLTKGRRAPALGAHEQAFALRDATGRGDHDYVLVKIAEPKG